MVSRATKLGRVECLARALTRDYRATRGDLQLRRAVTVQVGDAPGVLAVTGSAGRLDSHPNVVTVDEAYVVEVFACGTRADRELDQRDRWRAAIGAL